MYQDSESNQLVVQEMKYRFGNAFIDQIDQTLKKVQKMEFDVETFRMQTSAYASKHEQD